MTGAILGTETTGCTFICVNITGTKTNLGCKITSLPFKGEEVCVTYDFNVWRPTGLN
jgi:hypothetical protein